MIAEGKFFANISEHITFRKWAFKYWQKLTTKAKELIENEKVFLEFNNKEKDKEAEEEEEEEEEQEQEKEKEITEEEEENIIPYQIVSKSAKKLAWKLQRYLYIHFMFLLYTNISLNIIDY
jgi:hypothetical protein